MTMTLITPTCTCCPKPATLLPREDLGAGLATCPESGTLYRPSGQGYAPTERPPLATGEAPASQPIDLSQASYA